MIEGVRIEDDGPDGITLHLDGDFERPIARYLAGERDTLSLPINRDMLDALDQALQPHREHMAEGRAVQAMRSGFRSAGLCAEWVVSDEGNGPCMLPYGHDGDHDPEGGR